jgi:hypothetical protein
MVTIFPLLIAPLAALAPRGSRLAAAYFVVAPGRKSVSPRSSSGTAARDPVLIAPLGDARCVRLLASLAAMFAGLRPSSSEPTDRKALFRHLLLQIGGANIAGADRTGTSPTSSLLADEKRVGSFLLSSAARDPSYGPLYC